MISPLFVFITSVVFSVGVVFIAFGIVVDEVVADASVGVVGGSSASDVDVAYVSEVVVAPGILLGTPELSFVSPMRTNSTTASTIPTRYSCFMMIQTLIDE